MVLSMVVFVPIVLIALSLMWYVYYLLNLEFNTILVTTAERYAARKKAMLLGIPLALIIVLYATGLLGKLILAIFGLSH